MTIYLSAVLTVMYAIAVVTRWRCLKVCPELRGWYHLSILCCIASSASFAWILVYGDSPGRLIVVRCIQLVSVPCVYIWPSVIGERTRLAEQSARAKTGAS